METAKNALSPPSLSEHVYLSLKKQILKGDLAPGHRLIVMDIAKIYDVSQAPVREALERLKQEGLIVGKANRGSVVSEITSAEIRDIYQLRQLIEGHALRETMKVLTPNDIGYLEQILKDMIAAVDENDSYRLVELDMQFHGFFYRRCSNDLFLTIWDAIKTKIMRFISVTNQDYSGYSIPDAHAELLEIIKSGNVEKAEHKLIRGLDFYKRYTN